MHTSADGRPVQPTIIGRFGQRPRSRIISDGHCDWSSTILTARGLGRTRSCKFRRYPKTYLDVRTRDFFSSNLSSPSTQFPPSFRFHPVKMADVKKGKTPKEFLGAYLCAHMPSSRGVPLVLATLIADLALVCS